MTLDSLTGLFVEELKDVYDAEQQLLKTLPKMSEAAASEELKDAFTSHQARRWIDSNVSANGL